MPRRTPISLIFTTIVTLIFAAACKNVIDRREDVRPRVLRDVPAQNLAYRLSPDSSAPPDIDADDPTEKLEVIANEFGAKRTDDALLRTVQSPDGKRVLALYATADAPGSSFRIDLYNSEGQFIRNMIPPELSCVFPETVSWSPDGNAINFIAHKRAIPSPSPSPTPLIESLPVPDASPLPSPSVPPTFAPVDSYSTEQIYISDRDGYGLKPLTAREGLIYFYFAWAPDGHAMVALACKEEEWNERERQFRSPAGRPRLILPDGTERLLDDNLTDALPVWSPDSSKVATAFDTEIAVYDSAPNKPTQARVRLNDQLIAASIAYEQAIAAKKASPSPESGSASPSSPSPAPATSTTPASFNPIVRLEWTSPERLYFQTAYVRIMPSEVIKTFPRWHILNLSAQAAILK